MRRSPRDGREIPEVLRFQCNHPATDANSYCHIDKTGREKAKCRTCELARKRSFARFRDRVRAGR